MAVRLLGLFLPVERYAAAVAQGFVEMDLVLVKKLYLSVN